MFGMFYLVYLFLVCCLYFRLCHLHCIVWIEINIINWITLAPDWGHGVQYKLCLLVRPLAATGKAPDCISNLSQLVSGLSSRRIVQSYDRAVGLMNNYSHHARDGSSVNERSVYQLHEHGTVFLSTFAPPATPLPSRRNWKLFFSVKHFSFTPPCSLDCHSFIH